MASLPTVATASSVPKGALRAVAVRSDRLDADLPEGTDRRIVDGAGFTGKSGSTQLVGADAGPVLLFGLGPAEEVTLSTLRRAGGSLVRSSRRHGQLAVQILDAVSADGSESGGSLDPDEAAQALAEGLVLGGYRYSEYKERPAEHAASRSITVVVASHRKRRAAIERGVRVAEAVTLTRDLVNEPGGSLTPTAFADRARAVADRAGLKIRVLDEKAIAKERLGGLIGVNRGSTQPARFVELTHAPARAKATVALVGKGITFDSGGLSIKTAEGMTSMKSDMGGAAAVLGAMSVVPQMTTGIKVVAYLPMTDNMTGGDATRVGDVLRLRNGKTVEVLNTDAEGRLVLGDALAMASEGQPDAIIDLATLTGAAMVALGPRAAGLMSNNDGLADQVRRAAEAAGEEIWPLPLPKYLRSSLDSDIADLRNIGTGKYGGALTAGLFLQEFVGDGIPWAHLDIAGPAFVDFEEGEIGKGGTGFGVRLLLRLLADFQLDPATSQR